MRSQAVLKGTILYIDNRIWATDLTPDEAVEEINKLSESDQAPVGVRIIQPVRRYRRSQPGWPA